MRKPSIHFMFQTIKNHWLLSFLVFVLSVCSILVPLLPPLFLGEIVDLLSTRSMPSVSLFAAYFLLLLCSGLLDSAYAGVLVFFGQQMIVDLRKALVQKVNHLSPQTFVFTQPGEIVSRFTNDVDTVENLFTNGVIRMFTDLCKLIALYIMIARKQLGVFLVLLVVLPLVYGFTRFVQKQMLKAQLLQKEAVAQSAALLPETIHNIRTIHTLRKESFMQKRYLSQIENSYHAMKKNYFFDAFYSPVIILTNAIIVSIVMLFSVSDHAVLHSLFALSIGSAVTIISWINQIFSPIESIGMEIQTIQSAIAGLHRIDAFLGQKEEPEKTITSLDYLQPCLVFDDVSFAYEPDKPVLEHLRFSIAKGEHIYFSGRTGAGKSTIFKLILGQYPVDHGKLLIYGKDAYQISDTLHRSLFGYVEQSFASVPGTIAAQITLGDPSISKEAVIHACTLVGLDSVISSFPHQYEELYSPSLFSQGQTQLLSIARAIVSDPEILLLDEITANLDAVTEQEVLSAIKKATENRTVLSISHRLYQIHNARVISL